MGNIAVKQADKLSQNIFTPVNQSKAMMIYGATFGGGTLFIIGGTFIIFRKTKNKIIEDETKS